MKNNKLTVFMGVIGLAVMLPQTASAHEARHLCGSADGVDITDCHGAPATFKLSAGFANEPAWTGDVNGINLTISFHPDAAHDKTKAEPVNTSTGDEVKLNTAKVQYYADKNGKLELKRQKSLYPSAQNESDAAGNVKQKFGTPNVYNIYFRPNKAGTYGFHVAGTLKHKTSVDADGNPTAEHIVTQDFDQTFICGPLGTKDTHSNPPSKFNCVQDALAFPTGVDH
ncbi:hypothetical protein [Methylocaldum sp.]|uniref:hypothetical protein n=1 Tax=Methylocaldum sp. TaxID=1969727 RepID=UPI002D53860C|nr:hypothetical protein [Methylocaldum sp.]HYE34662.1 hypothetical protein [Methylocaldum sp.]